ncbi:Adenylylsulfate kinase [hydrothermal vent metagenome]|uniref:adenylyl-sulfate kinase n=1 Tax=hydrothermal vent metagenome TaxID=652676 RepID=A0A1W1EIU7_9ZZZZ
MSNKNIVWHNQHIKKEDRAKRLNQKPRLIWFTGLSGSGKSTIANALEVKLYQLNYHTMLLDGDNIRFGLNRDLGFSDEDRVENIRRISEVAKLFIESGTIVITAFISPFQSEREYAKSILQDDEFVEVFVDTPIEICQLRDPKGLYKKALNGEIKNFTGIDSPYEVPQNPDIIIKTSSVDDAVDMIVEYLKD